jgi:phosphopentomutase
MLKLSDKWVRIGGCMMTKKRLIILDLASLGIGEAPDANRFSSVGADTLGYVASNGLSVSNLAHLGLGNIRWDNEIPAIPTVDKPMAFYGKMVNRVANNGISAGFREMFDYTTGLRTVSVMDLMAEQKLNVSIISSFANYLEKQDAIHSVQVSNDSKAFIELHHQLAVQKTGLIYCQLPCLHQIAQKADVATYVQQLEKIDRKLSEILQVLTDDDMLIITASFAKDCRLPMVTTREYLPLIVYNPQRTVGKSLGIKRSSGAVANFIAAYFNLDASQVTKPNFIQEVK